MHPPRPLRVGIIGAGGIARHYHVPSYRRCDHVHIVAACDVNPAALEQLHADCDEIEILTTDYRELLAIDGLDLISICTSNDMHHPIAMAAIAQGLDIYCEKPLARTLAEAKEMYAAATAAGTKTGVNFSHRQTPAAKLAKEILDRGALGQIFYVSAIYAAGGTNYAQRSGSWRNDRNRAGFGGMGDMGSHMIDMMLWWLGCEITAVACQMRTFVPERRSGETGLPMNVTTEDQGTLLVNYANGAMGYFCGSYVFTGRGYDQRVEIYGSEGGLIYNQQRPYELDVYLAPEILQDYDVLRQGGTRDTPYTTILVPERLWGKLPARHGAIRTVLMEFIETYRSDGPFCFQPSFHEGLQVQQVLEAAAHAAASRRWVDLPL